jgi:ProP effector
MQPADSTTIPPSEGTEPSVAASDTPPLPAEAEAAVADALTAEALPLEAVPAEAAPADLSPAQCSARLGALFPALFRLQQPLPLKLRIQADIQARAPGVFTRKSLSGFLHRYTTGTPYLLALTRQTERFDLDGQPAGELAAEHREAAVTELARRRAIVEERRAAERAQQQQAQKAQREQQEADQQGRRERGLLLRAFETSTLTRANFCALKGLDDSGLDALLAQARQEAAERPAPAPQDQRPPRRDTARPPSRPGSGRPSRPPGRPR